MCRNMLMMTDKVPVMAILTLLPSGGLTLSCHAAMTSQQEIVVIGIMVTS